HRLEQRLPSVGRWILVAQAEHIALLTAAPPDLLRAGRAGLRRGELHGRATVVLHELVDSVQVRRVGRHAHLGPDPECVDRRARAAATSDVAANPTIAELRAAAIAASIPCVRRNEKSTRSRPSAART